jgi:hypothetical protein
MINYGEISMSSNLAEKIAEKASHLPVEAQRKALEYVEALEREVTLEKKPFRSVKGVLQADLSHLEKDIAEIRRDSLRKDYGIGHPHDLVNGSAGQVRVNGACHSHIS